MQSRIIHFILQVIVFGVGAGIRYIFFLLIGKRKTYDSLITPDNQDKWNILIGFLCAGTIVYLVLTYLHTPKENTDYLFDNRYQ